MDANEAGIGSECIRGEDLTPVYAGRLEIRPADHARSSTAGR